MRSAQASKKRSAGSFAVGRFAVLGVVLCLAWPLAAAQRAEVAEAAGRDPLAKAVIAETETYLKDKQTGHYDKAYALVADSMRTYLTADLFKDTATRFAADAGKPGKLLLTRFTWYRDPPDAPEPGLYAAVDYSAEYEGLHLMCGYVMWHQVKGGGFKVVRDEQNFIDDQGFQQMVPEQREKLPTLFGCVTS